MPPCRRKISFRGVGAIPSSALVAINVVALFARLRLVVADEYAQLFTDRALEPNRAGELLVSQAYNVILGAFGALASYALFHVVTVFPLAWIMLFCEAVGDRVSRHADRCRDPGDMRRHCFRSDRGPDRPDQDARLACRADRHLQRLLTDAIARRRSRTELVHL